MKLKKLFRSEAPILTCTLFFAGVVLSGGAMYTFQTTPEEITLYHLCGTIALTFFLGWASIYYTARSVQQTVVYVTRKEESDLQADDNTAVTAHQLMAHDLDEILRRGGGDLSQSMINALARQLQSGQIALYVSVGNAFELKCGFALPNHESRQYTYANGEGLVGRVAETGNALLIDKLPKDYITVFSGLGAASPTCLAIVALKNSNEIKGVLEIATFIPLTTSTIRQLEDIGKAWTAVGL